MKEAGTYLQEIVDKYDRMLQSGVENMQRMAEYQQVGLWEETTEEQIKNRDNLTPTISDDVRYQARDIRGNVVTDNATPAVVRQYLEDIYNDKYKGQRLSIPVLQHTPQVFFDYCNIDGDRTFVMSANKAYNAMKGNSERQHSLGVDGLMEVIHKLHAPDYIVYQRGGQNAGHYVAVVTVNGGETVAAVDVGDYRAVNDAVNGENGYYNVLITAFPADSNYIDNNILTENNDIVYDSSVDKKYEAPVYVADSDSLMDVQTNASSVRVSQGSNSVNSENVESVNTFPDSGESTVMTQLRSSPLSDRSMLQIALDTPPENMTAAERDNLRIFKSRLDKLNGLVEQREEQGRIYRENQFSADGDRTEALKAKNRMDDLRRCCFVP